MRRRSDDTRHDVGRPRRRGGRGHLAVFVALLLCAWPAALGCGGVELSLQLRPGIDEQTGEPFDTSALRTLRVRMLDGDGVESDVEVPLERDRQSDLGRIDPGSGRVSLDVWACDTEDGCADEDRQFRACTLLDLRQQTGGSADAVPVVLALYPDRDPRVRSCPLPVPTA